MEPVTPLMPPAAYIGGKRSLAAAICERIDRIPHVLYAEPFVGMGGVFFRRRRRPTLEVINDLSRDVATLFRVLKRHPTALIEEIFDLRLLGRAEFERLAASDPAVLTDIERAARFYYLQRNAFGGKVEHRVFGVQKHHARTEPGRDRRLLAKIHERLAGVVIECLPYGELLRRYDRPEALFYLDPPYWGSEGDYGADAFARAEFTRLAGRLAALEGRFLLSLNDTPEVRLVFRDFAIEQIEVVYTIAQGDAARRTELIVSDGRGDAGRLF